MSTALEMAAVESGNSGVISEDVIAKLFDISAVERPVIDLLSTGTADNFKKEFTDHALRTSSSTNTAYENEDLSARSDGTKGLRYGNQCQQMVGVIKMSQRGRDVSTTYNSDQFLKELMQEGEALRLDEEAAAISRNAATPEVAATSGALMAGMATWAIHNTQRGVGGADAVLDGTTGAGGSPTTAPAVGTARGMTMAMLQTALRDGWQDGARYSHLVSTGAMIENIAGFMYDSTARVAAMQTNVAQGNRRGVGDGNGAQDGGVVAQGSVNIFVGNFGTIILTPDREATTYTSTDTECVDVLLFDSSYGNMSYLSNYQTEPLGKNGLYDQVVLFADCCYIPEATHSLTTISDINPETAMTA